MLQVYSQITLDFFIAPMYLENVLIYDFILFYNYKNFMNLFQHWNTAFKDSPSLFPGYGYCRLAPE